MHWIVCKRVESHTLSEYVFVYLLFNITTISYALYDV